MPSPPWAEATWQSRARGLVTFILTRRSQDARAAWRRSSGVGDFSRGRDRERLGFLLLRRCTIPEDCETCTRKTYGLLFSAEKYCITSITMAPMAIVRGGRAQGARKVARRRQNLRWQPHLRSPPRWAGEPGRARALCRRPGAAELLRLYTGDEGRPSPTGVPGGNARGRAIDLGAGGRLPKARRGRVFVV